MNGFIQAIISTAILLLFEYCVSVSYQKDTLVKAVIISSTEIIVLVGILFCIWDGLKSIFGLPSFFAKFKGKSKKKKAKKLTRERQPAPKNHSHLSLTKRNPTRKTKTL